jgi:hypothetical protein
LSRPATLEKWKVDLRPDEEDAIKLGALRRSLEEAREELRYMKTRASDSLPGRKTPGTFPEPDVDVVVGMNCRLTPKLRARELAAPVGDHFIHVMLNCVPLPVIQTCRGNMSSWRPARISSQV